MNNISNTSKTQEEYLPQYTLDQLANRVAFKLSYFSSKFSPDTIWKEVLEYCSRVEKNPMSIDTIILIVRNEKEVIVSNPTVDIRKFHTLLTRIFILLYYKFGSDIVYRSHVFTELMKYMGVYATEKNMNTIYEGIRKIHKFEKELEDSKRKQNNELNKEESQSQFVCQNQMDSLTSQLEGLKSENEQLRNVIAEKDKEIAELKEKIACYEAKEEQEIEDEKLENALYNKVCYEFFLLLLNHVGLNINASNKTDVGRLWRMITGQSVEGIRQYCSTRNYVNKNTGNDIKTLNCHLKKLGITTIQL